jgi:Sec7 domain/FYVE zinc finger/Mon2/Sec7/BIG1-like, HUS domain/PH domain
MSGRISFQLDGTGIPSVVDGSGAHIGAAGHSRVNTIGTNPLTSQAVSSIGKIMNDVIAQRHVFLQRECIAALDQTASNTVEAHAKKFSEATPIIDLCLISASSKDKEIAPIGFEPLDVSPKKIPAHILKTSSHKFILCYRRADVSSGTEVDIERPSSASDAKFASIPQTRAPRGSVSVNMSSRSLYTPADLESQWSGPITDIRVAPRDEIPFGYIALLESVGGVPVDSQLVLCYSRSGSAQLKHLAVVHPQKQEKVPTGHLLLKQNLNSQSNNDSDNAFLCIGKDLAPMLQKLHGMKSDRMDAHSHNNPKYIAPFLVACHIREPVLGTVALLSLQTLVSEGLFTLAPEDMARCEIHAIVMSCCEALSNSYEPNFQAEIVNLLQLLCKLHFSLISLEGVGSIIRSAFHVTSRSVRTSLLEGVVRMAVYNPHWEMTHPPAEESDGKLSVAPGLLAAAGLDPNANSDDEESTEGFMRSFVQDIVSHTVNARISAPMQRQFAKCGLHSNDLIEESANIAIGIFEKEHERALGVILLVLSRVAMESRHATMRMRYKFGIARRHHALNTLLFTLNLMHLASGGSLTDVFGASFRHSPSTNSSTAGDSKTAKLASSISMQSDESQPDIADIGQQRYRQPSIVANMQFYGKFRCTMNRSFAMIVRRFVVSAILRICTPEFPPYGPPCFLSVRCLNPVLSIISCLLKLYPNQFKSELGILFENVLLEYVSRPETDPALRQLIVSRLREMFAHPQTAINLFYNFDNRSNWPIMERLISVVGDLAQESSPLMLFMTSSESKSSIASAGASSHQLDALSRTRTRSRATTVEFDAAIDDVPEDEEDDPTAAAIAAAAESDSKSVNGSKSAASIIAEEEAAISADAGPELKMSPSVRSRTARRMSLQSDTQFTCTEFLVQLAEAADRWQARRTYEKKREAFRAIRKRSMDIDVDGNPEEEWDEDEFKRQVNDRLYRKGTVLVRHDKNSEEKKTINKALRMARIKSLKKAVAWLEGVGFLKHDPKAIVQFVQTQKRLALEDVGDFLGGSKPRDDAPFEDAIRLEYIRRLHFLNMSLTDALRRFLTSSGFRLPPEAQKIDRMLECFGQVFSEQNLDAFSHRDAAYVLSNAILMLNTSLHNPNMREKDRITLDRFQIMCRGIDGSHYSDEDLAIIFNEIKKNPYEIELPGTIDFKKAKQKKKEEKAGLTDFEKHAHKLENILRRASGALQRSASAFEIFVNASDPATVQSMFEVSWYNFMAYFSHVIEHTTDTRLVQLCMDGFKHALRISMRVGVRQEQRALGTSLARFVFVNNNRLSKSPKSELDINRALVTGEHTKLDWLDLMGQLPSRDPKSVGQVGHVVDDLKREYIRQTNFKVLREVQERLDGDISLVRAGRFFIREGNVGKICSNKDLVEYRLFLFSDALLYGSRASGENRYKPHRVILLAFADVQPLPPVSHNQYGFRISSPQKSVVLAASSQQSRDGWIASIRSHIDKQSARRQEIVDEIKHLADEGKHGITMKDVVKFSKTAGFLGRNIKKVRKGNFEAEDVPTNHCPLCWTPYRMFKSATQCKSCGDMVCSKCIKHKVTPMKHKKKTSVCDGCYFFSNEFQSADKIALVQFSKPN